LRERGRGRVGEKDRNVVLVIVVVGSEGSSPHVLAVQGDQTFLSNGTLQSTGEKPLKSSI
jgi:hypothetical protein